MHSAFNAIVPNACDTLRAPGAFDGIPEKAAKELLDCGFLAYAASCKPLSGWRERAGERYAGMSIDIAMGEEWARSVWMLVMPFCDVTDWPEDSMEVSGYYFVSNALYSMAIDAAQRMESLGIRAKLLRRTPPLKPLACRAGVGAYGAQGLIFNHAFGANIGLQALITDVPYDGEDAPDYIARRECLNCDICVRACPTAAITAHGVIDREKCIRNFMIPGGPPPEWIQKHTGKRLLGCDICRLACPHGYSSSIPIPQEIAKLFNICTLMHDPDMPAIGEYIGENYAKAEQIKAVAQRCYERGRNNA